ncbi:MAG TPA: PAS domain S-box protein [Gemmatimonadales bacterium]|nr:PAS domain S-box protein [Gemmatimonadales bacterium]
MPQEQATRLTAPMSELLDSLNAIVYEVDAATYRFTYVSQQSSTILGFPPERFCKDVSWETLVHPDDKAEVFETCARATREMRNHSLEFRVLDASGRVRWVRDVASVIVENDRPVKLRGLLVDITERKQADEEVRRTLSLLTATLESTTDGILVVDLDGKVQSFNRQFTELWRIPEDLAATRNDARLIEYALEQLDDPAAFLDRVRNLYRQPEATAFDILRFKDGRLVERFSQPQRLGGRVVGRVWSFRDVTERERAQRALRLSQHRFEDLVNSIRGIVWEADASTLRFTFVSRRAEQLLGYPPERWISEPTFWMDHMHPDDRESAVQSCRQATAARQPHELEYRMIAADGRVVWLHDLVTVTVENGVPAFLRGVMLDVTERKLAELALRASEKRYREAVASFSEFWDNAVFGFYRSSIDGRLTMVNHTLVRMLGYGSAEELLGSDLALDVYADPGERAKLIDQFGGGERFEGIETTWKRKDGVPVPVLLSGRSLREEGRIVGFEGIVENVSERRQLEEQLRQAQKMEAVGRLAGGIAHDFNNILTAIIGACELLEAELGRHPGVTEVREIRASADRAADLTRQLLAFSRKQVLQPKVIDLNALVRNAERLLRRLIGEDIRLVTELEPGLRPVRVDPGQMEQVIVNLAVNARDAMPHGGTLVIETQNIELGEPFMEDRARIAPGSYVRLSLSDNGAGMDAHTKAHLFEPFFTTKEPGKGTGLGLATVYGIVKQSSGFVTVYSEVGHGTTFRIYLPSVARPVDVSAPRPMDKPRGGTETILLVEDDSALRRVVRRALEQHGYRVIEAPSGDAALQVAANHPDERIHLLLTDLVMPGMGGPALAERLTARDPELRVLFMSGYTETGIVRQGVLDPTVAFLQKPFTLSELLLRVRSALDEPRSQGHGASR